MIEVMSGIAMAVLSSHRIATGQDPMPAWMAEQKPGDGALAAASAMMASAQFGMVGALLCPSAEGSAKAFAGAIADMERAMTLTVEGSIANEIAETSTNA